MNSVHAGHFYSRPSPVLTPQPNQPTNQVNKTIDGKPLIGCNLPGDWWMGCMMWSLASTDHGLTWHRKLPEGQGAYYDHDNSNLMWDEGSHEYFSTWAWFGPHLDRIHTRGGPGVPDQTMHLRVRSSRYSSCCCAHSHVTWTRPR